MTLIIYLKAKPAILKVRTELSPQGKILNTLKTEQKCDSDSHIAICCAEFRCGGDVYLGITPIDLLLKSPPQIYELHLISCPPLKDLTSIFGRL